MHRRYYSFMSHGETSIANIGPRQRRRRLIGGSVALGVAALLSAWLIAGDAPRWWRLLLVVPLFAAASGILQYREKT